MRVPVYERFNISMHLMDGQIQDRGIWGMKVEFWDDHYHRWAPEASLFFYDHRIQMKVHLLSQN